MSDRKNKPLYVAIIMDGNGRWARQRGKSRTQGHEEGAANVRRIVRDASELGIKELTLYAFSTENWSRSPKEVKFLMNLLEEHLVAQREEIMEQDVKFTAIGDLSRMPVNVRREMAQTERISIKNKGLHARLALNYGGRLEILDAVAKICRERKSDRRMTEKQFRKYLYDPSMHDPDLLIRTGGEMRISNFLLWQVSYSELYFTDVLWPDFGKKELEAAIEDYSGRERRFGKA